MRMKLLRVEESKMAYRRFGLAMMCSSALSACASLSAPETPLIGGGDVAPVVTEHSFGLKCLGQLIEDGDRPALVVHVDRIRDRTIPPRLNDDARLSQAGEWLFHTAISKMETPRVRSTLSGSSKLKREPGRLTISGAWTQDDEVLRRQDGDIDGEVGRFRFGLDREQRYDYIAGDFTSSSGDVVTFASAIGVMLASGEFGARLLVENSGDFVDVEFEKRWADGPQMAQRRIAEAAALVHIARHYAIDYQPCLAAGWSAASSYRQSLKDFADMAKVERQKKLQEELNALGYDAGAADGVWGAASMKALMRYQTENNLPVTGRPSAVIYALIAADSSASAASQSKIASAE
jgi:hypothetical protein